MKVIIAIDGQDSADAALEHVVARNYGADTVMHLVHVIAPMFADTHVEGLPDVTSDERKEEQVILGSLASALKAKLGVQATTAILSGDIAPVIAEECKRFGADELIVPSHARHGFSKLWFGSVADNIVDEAPCATLVLKMPHQAKH